MTNFDDLNTELLKEFGETVVYLQPPLELLGIWIDPATRETTAPGITLLLFFSGADFGTYQPQRGDELRFRGEQYDVVTVAADAGGGTLLGLKRG